MARTARQNGKSALERLRETAPDGPPFLQLILDEPTVRCLALGVVNSRAQVAAAAVVKALDEHTLTEKPA